MARSLPSGAGGLVLFGPPALQSLLPALRERWDVVQVVGLGSELHRLAHELHAVLGERAASGSSSEVLAIEVDEPAGPGAAPPRDEPPPPPIALLTERETEVLHLFLEGRTSKEIALHLGVQRVTVDTHRHNLMRKLGVRNVVELVKWAIRSGVTSP